MEVSKLKVFRTAAGYNQLRLANALSVSEKLISAWECGRANPGDDYCFLIAKIFDVDPAEIWPNRFSTIPK